MAHPDLRWCFPFWRIHFDDWGIEKGHPFWCFFFGTILSESQGHYANKLRVRCSFPTPFSTNQRHPFFLRWRKTARFVKIKPKWWFPQMGIPQSGWFIMENPTKIDDLGVPPFMEPPNGLNPLFFTVNVRFCPLEVSNWQLVESSWNQRTYMKNDDIHHV